MMMRALGVLLVVLALLMQYRLWIADGGMREVWRLRDQVATQREENAALQERNRTLSAEVQDLKRGKAAVEERARTDLGMVGKDETFFQVVTAKPPGQSSSEAGPASVRAQFAER